MPPETGQPAPAQPAEEAGETGETGETAGVQPVLSGRTVLDLRREFMLARKAWVDGGKVGPPPTPPDAS